MKISGVYKIQSLLKPHKVYIGSAVKIGNRWSLHLWHLRHNHHPNKKLQYHFNKYGEYDLQFSVISNCDKDDLIRLEQYFLDLHKPWFNIRLVADSNYGLKASDTTKELRRQSMLGKNKGKPSWNKGKKQSPEWIAKKVAKTKGQKREKKGPHSEKTKQLMREKALIRPRQLQQTSEFRRNANLYKFIPVSQYDNKGNFIRSFDCLRDVQKITGISASNIGAVLKGRRKTAGSFIWKILEKQLN